MGSIPVYDNHIHMSPHGRNVSALKEYASVGGTALTLVTLPHPEVRITQGRDFRDSYEITASLADQARAETGLEINLAVGPYPVLLLSLAEKHGLAAAVDIMMEGMEIAGRMVEEGKAVAIGEIGRPHFECSPDIMEASDKILGRGMEIAKENNVPVIIHCESGTTDTNRNLADIARKSGLDPRLVIKHSSPPFVLPEETFDVFPSIPASKTNIKEALGKGTTRFMLETDYIDEPDRPSAIMSVTTVPHKVQWMLRAGLADEETIYHICKDLPDWYYKR